MNCFRSFIYLIGVFLLVQCNKSAGAEEVHYDTIQQQQKADTVQKETVVKKEIKYHAFVVKNKNKDFKAVPEKLMALVVSLRSVTFSKTGFPLKLIKSPFYNNISYIYTLVNF